MASTSSRSKSRPAVTKRVSRKSAAAAEEVVNSPPSPAPVRSSTPVRASARKVAAAPAAQCPAVVSFFSDEIYGAVKHFLLALFPALFSIALLDHFGLVPKYVEPLLKERFGEKGQVAVLLAGIHLVNFVILPLLLESSQAGKQLPECPSLMPQCCHKVYGFQQGASQILVALVSAILAAVLKQTSYSFIFAKSFQATLFLVLGLETVWCGCSWWRSLTRTGASIAILQIFYVALAKQ